MRKRMGLWKVIYEALALVRASAKLLPQREERATVYPLRLDNFDKMESLTCQHDILEISMKMGLIRFKIGKQNNGLKVEGQGVKDTPLQGINSVVLAV